MYRPSFLFLIVLSTLINTAALRAETLIEGIILDAETEQPIVGVNVISGRQGAVSDADGHFAFSGDPDKNLVIRHIGYEPEKILPNGHTLRIFLHPQVIEGAEIVIQSGYYTAKMNDQNASIAVMDLREINQSKALHFQDILDRIPNLNYAGGTSRPRYFQIRGIGERSQFAGEGSPVFSVGFIFDDYDMTGISMSAFLFGVDQIEVYRGPQSSVFGPSAIGGLIYMHGKNPPQQFELDLKLSTGSYGLLEKALSVGSSHFGGRYAHRLTALSYQHNGFQHNAYYNRDDLNGKDEVVVYYKGRIQFNQNLKSHISFLHSKSENGYDAWAPDNGRISYADQPGVDDQTLNGYSANTIWTPNRDNTVKVSMAQTLSEMVYSYDSDWANNEYWSEAPYNFDPLVEGWEYSFFDETYRDRLTQQLDINWNYIPHGEKYNLTSGIFVKNLTENDSASGWLFGGDDFELMSEFDIQVRSGYAQFQYELNEQITALVNLRGEYRTTDYSDDNDINFSVTDTLWGWKSSVDYRLTEASKIFLTYARGYKGGGINQHPKLADENRPYRPESLDNFELGYRYQGTSHRVAATLFYGVREDQQVSLSRQQNENDPNSFVYFTANAASGYQYGLEFEGDYLPFPRLRLDASLGLLNSHVDAYSFMADAETMLTLGDRAVAYAPLYSYQAGLQYKIKNDLSASFRMRGKDEFYFSDSHNQKNQAYTLVDMDISYVFHDVELSLWGKNILDTDYGIRGFYFGLEPPDYEDKLYIQLGDPRQIGLSLDFSFSR